MSGIAGIVSADRSPADPAAAVRAMTDALAFRGPDGLRTWTDGAAALGHAWLRTGPVPAEHAEPASLDGLTWITADARLDGRAELIAKLTLGRSGDLAAVPDAMLILHAYRKWRAACVEHLLGDFAFAIWDASARTLFCARDRFGVKPFYYASTGSAFVFSNTVDSIRVHPAVGASPNDLAIADFLIFGYNQDPATTAFADVHRLPPAHSLTVMDGTVRVERYWELPIDGRIRYRHSGEYVERFTELFRAAVADRIDGDGAGVWMSGGLDSTAVAATAHEVVTSNSPGGRIRAYTTVYDALIPDDERRFASLVAEAVGFEVTFRSADTFAPFDGFEQPGPTTAEPIADPYFFARLQQLRDASRHSRILLCGEGGDEVFRHSDALDLVRRMPAREFAADLFRTLLTHRRRPALGVRRRLRASKVAQSDEGYPPWLNNRFAERLGTRERWDRLRHPAGSPHPLRPEAYRRLTTPAWPWYFEFGDPGATRVPLEARYPFLDVRLVDFLLAIPPLPWCIDKLLLRLAMGGALPDAVRLRPKTPLGEDPFRAHLRTGGTPGLMTAALGPEMDRYVDRRSFSAAVAGAIDPWLNARAVGLDCWLRRLSAPGSVLAVRGSHAHVGLEHRGHA